MNFKENESDQKLRGGYYTPPDIANFLCRWVAECEPKQVLEPSCGDGVFLAEAAKTNLKNVTAFELDKVEAAKSRQRAEQSGLVNFDVKIGDFLEWALPKIKQKRRTVDAVIGNPPFIRYQYLPRDFQTNAEQVFAELDCKFTKHTNAWVPFVLTCFNLLRPSGRLAMVVPAEIVHVTHAQSLRTYLGTHARKLVIIDPKELWFEGTLQGAVILLVEKKVHESEHTEGLGILPVSGRAFLSEQPSDLFEKPQAINGRTVAGKWTRALLGTSTLDLLDELVEEKKAAVFRDLADVDVGIVTGANKFFLVDDDTVKKYGLTKWAHPMFGRSDHCRGIIYDSDQHSQNARDGKPTNFIWFPKDKKINGKKVTEYIELGEADRLHERYKCRIRSPWYSVPSVYSSQIGMLKRSHNAPRLIFNEVNAFTTDTAYRISTRADIDPKRFVYSFINSLTALSAELEGRHYGGGVLELVPSEIEKLLVPNFESGPVDLKKLDSDVRTLDTDSLLEKQSKKIFESLDISSVQSDLILNAWKQLRDRRQRVTTELN